jgi:hypothetical protein
MPDRTVYYIQLLLEVRLGKIFFWKFINGTLFAVSIAVAKNESRWSEIAERAAGRPLLLPHLLRV